MEKLTKNSPEWLEFLKELDQPETRVLTGQFHYVKNHDVDRVKDKLNLNWQQIQHLVQAHPKERRGTFNLSPYYLVQSAAMTNQLPAMQSSGDIVGLSEGQMKSVRQLKPYIPMANPVYVPWGGNTDMVNAVIAGRQFFPIYIEGPSGTGKTELVEQACAKAKREYVRIQINPETDEDDLLGGLRLIGDETVFVYGPVTCAMLSGALLMIDEIDRGSTKLMCLQGILEGKPVLIKKTGETIVPASGFNIIATANTLGRGSDDGKYISASVIDDAFLERFPITLVQGYAPEKIEKQILVNHADAAGVGGFKYMPQIVETLVKWAINTRKTKEEGAIADEISTRRLCHIVNTMRYTVTSNIDIADKSAVESCLNRYEEDTKQALKALYDAVRPARFVDPAAQATGSRTSEDLQDDLADRLRRTMSQSGNPSPF